MHGVAPLAQHDRHHRQLSCLGFGVAPHQAIHQAAALESLAAATTLDEGSFSALSKNFGKHRKPPQRVNCRIFFIAPACLVLKFAAPGWFAACINQAPSWRRTCQPWLRVYDYAANAIQTWTKTRQIPPDQLLRQVFEACDSYWTARRMLEATPVAQLVIYTLIGCEAGKRCVIERCEDSFVTRESATSVANDWFPTRPQWEG